jgi:hypothetical protein
MKDQVPLADQLSKLKGAIAFPVPETPKMAIIQPGVPIVIRKQDDDGRRGRVRDSTSKVGEGPLLTSTIGPSVIEVPLTQEQSTRAAEQMLRTHEMVIERENAVKWQAWAGFALTTILSIGAVIAMGKGLQAGSDQRL